MFRIIFLTLVLADSSYSQGHIKYSDGSGTKVDWKLYAPYSQFKSQLQHYQRRDNAKSLSEQSRIIQTPAGVAAKSPVGGTRYKPFSQVPDDVKQIFTQSYQSQTPYVDPEAFLHQIPQLPFGEVIPRKSQPMEHEPKSQSTIVKFQNYQEQREREQHEQSFGAKGKKIQHEGNQVPVNPVMSNHQSFNFDRSVPVEIQQLLQYQAQIPYNIIANHIIYKPDTPFIPEPLLEDEDEVGPYKYRSRVYYAVQNDMRSNKAQEHPGTEDQN